MHRVSCTVLAGNQRARVVHEGPVRRWCGAGGVRERRGHAGAADGVPPPARLACDVSPTSARVCVRAPPPRTQRFVGRIFQRTMEKSEAQLSVARFGLSRRMNSWVEH